MYGERMLARRHSDGRYGGLDGGEKKGVFVTGGSPINLAAHGQQPKKSLKSTLE
jgi:hypothetical protein